MALMEKALAGCGEALDIAVLLGNHADHGGFLPSIDPDFVREVRRIETQLPRNVKGHGSGGELVRKEVKRATARAQAVRIIRRAILGAAPERMLHASPREPQGERVCAVLPYRTGVDRRAAVYELLGSEPLAYRAESWARSSRVYEPIHVYVDVSGSMDHLLPLIYAALRPLLPLIHKKIHLFSTVIRDVRPAAIHRGISETTQGTDLGCVLGHILNNRIRRALLITDGEFDAVTEAQLSRLQTTAVQINSIITTPGNIETVSSLSGRVFRLPSLNKE
jgi:hypothetical protein